MRRLTDRTHWDSIYSPGAEPVTEKQESSPGLRRRLKNAIKRSLGDYWRNYDDYMIWDVLLQSYLPKNKGAKLLEVGSAPGGNLVRMHKTFDYSAYGVEYSANGVALNRDTFTSNGMDVNQVIHADFFSEAFQQEYRETFDIVFSAGFIEHFDDAESVIQKHVSLLKKGGTLVVLIPRLKGINYFLCKIFNPDAVPLHNLSIMSAPAFERLFNPSSLQFQYCDYLGVFSVYVVAPTHATSFFVRHAYSCCLKFQVLLNVGFRVIFGRRGARTEYFSPYLAFVGIKK